MSDLGTLAASIAAVAAAVITGGRWLGKRWLGPWWHKVDQALDAVAGHDAVHDKQTGRELIPAQPGIGVRMASIEAAVAGLVRHETRVDRLEHEFLTHRSITDNRLTKLEAAVVERVAGHLDSAAAFDAIKAVAESTNDAQEGTTDESHQA